MKEYQKNLIQEYQDKLEISKILASVLINKDFSIKDSDIILNHVDKGIKYPDLLANSKEAANTIIDYMNNKNAVICIFGDYDCDGITSTKILYSVLKKYGICTSYYYVPQRSEGYGINNKFIDESIEYNKDSGKDMLIITVDNGIAAYDKIQRLIDNNINCVVLDHHILNGKKPNCICVDPSAFHDGFEYLCGAGVAFKIGQLISWNYDDGSDMIYLTPFLALGTIGDEVPLSVENICLIKYGLAVINSKECPLSIKQYKDYKGKKSVSAVDIAWEISPLINACGRMGNVQLAMDFVTSEDTNEVENYLINMISLNEDRKSLTKQAEKEISKLSFDNDKVCIFNASEYPAGLSGIIAGKIENAFNKPAVVLSGDKVLTGSVRSVKGIDINASLQTALKKDILLSAGGHKGAAGLSIEKSKIDDLQVYFNNTIENVEVSEPVLNIVDIITLKDVNKEVLNSINEIPFGNSPLFLIKNIELKSHRYSKNNHNNICITIKDDITTLKDIWCWKLGNVFDDLMKQGFDRLNIIGSIDTNFINKNQITFNIKDVKIAEG